MSVDDYRARLAQGEEITFTQSRGVLLRARSGAWPSCWSACGSPWAT